LFALIVLGSFLILGNLATTYSSDSVTTGSMGEIQNISEKMNSQLSDEFSAVKDTTLLANVDGGQESEDSLIRGAYKATKNAPTTARLAGKMISAVARALSLPDFVVQSSIIILGISLVFSVVYLIFRFKG